MNLPSVSIRRTVPGWASREQLLEFVRAHCPDLRLRFQALPDGQRAARADLTIRGAPLSAECVESADIPDIDDEIVRRCAWLLYTRLGFHRPMSEPRRRELETQILEASARGDTAAADMLALELVKLNEGLVPTENTNAP